MRLLFAMFLTLMSSLTYCSVEKYTLANGLKVVVKEDHRAPVAVVMVWYNIGSADEPGGITGVSHALEHMMFKGTPRFPQGVFSKTIAGIGGQDNAFTNSDYTVYFEKISNSQIPTALELEADRMQNLILDQQEFAHEIKVIQEERRMRTDDNPQALTLERYLATAHLSSPYHHPVIGWMNDLQQMTVNDLRAWYQHFYVPNNATLVVVGDVKAEKILDLAKLYFGEIKKRPQYVRKMQKEPPALGSKLVEIHAPAQLPMLMFGYTVPSVHSAKEKWQPYALEILAGLLDAGDSSRLTKDLIRGGHIASGAQVYYSLYARYQTQFIVFGIPAQGHQLNELQAALLKEIHRLQTETISPTELARVKTQLIAEKTFEKDSIFGQGMEIGLLETLGLGWQTAEEYSKNIDAITPAQIQEAARLFFKPQTMTEARLFPLSQPKEQK